MASPPHIFTHSIHPTTPCNVIRFHKNNVFKSFSYRKNSNGSQMSKAKIFNWSKLNNTQNTTQYLQNSAIYSPKLALYSKLPYSSPRTCCIHYKFRFLLRKQQQQTRRLRNNLAELLLRNILPLFSLLGTSNSSVLSLIPMYLVRPIPASTVLSSPTSVARVCTIPLEHNICHGLSSVFVYVHKTI